MSLTMPSRKESTTATTLATSGEPRKLTPITYETYSDEELDRQIVRSVGAAQSFYNRLREEVVIRLLPALAEMRRRHGAQGVRNDLNSKLGLPRKAGWEEYLRSRGLRPDTVRGWFQKFTGVKTLDLLVSGNDTSQPENQATRSASNEPLLFRATVANRILIVAANSIKHATDILAKNGVSEYDIEELGQLAEISSGSVTRRTAQQIPQKRAASEDAILKALTGHPGALPSDIAKRLGVSAVDVRRVAIKHRKNLRGRRLSREH